MTNVTIGNRSAFHPIDPAQLSQKPRMHPIKVIIPTKPQPVITASSAALPKATVDPTNPKAADKTSQVAKDQSIAYSSPKKSTTPKEFSPGRRTPGRKISPNELSAPHRNHYMDALDQHGEAVHFGSPAAKMIAGKELQKIRKAEKFGKPKHTLLPLEYGSPRKTMDRIRDAGGVVVGFDGMIQSPGGTKFKAAKVTDPKTGSQKFVLYPTEENPGAVVVNGSQLGRIFREIDSTSGSSCDDILRRISPLSRTPTPPSLSSLSRRSSSTQSLPMDVALAPAASSKRTRFDERSSPDLGNSTEVPKKRKPVVVKRKDQNSIPKK